MLQTTRLIFRPYRNEDYAFYLRLWQDPDMVRFIGSGEIHATDQLKTNFPYWLSKSSLGKGVLLMLLRSTYKSVGHAGLVPQLIDGQEEMEIGYWVAKRYWNQGLATEAAVMFRDIAFHELKRARLISIIQPDNHSSIRVATKIGMRFEKHTVFKGIPVHIYAMERGES